MLIDCEPTPSNGSLLNVIFAWKCSIYGYRFHQAVREDSNLFFYILEDASNKALSQTQSMYLFY